MNILLVSKNENLQTCKRIFQEARNLGLQIDHFNPEHFTHSFDEANHKFQQAELCLNRYSSVNGFDQDLSFLGPYNHIHHINDLAGISLARCKLKQILFLQKNNLPYIQSIIINGVPQQDEIDLFLQRHGECYVSKPLRGNGGRGITLFESKRSTQSFIESCFHLNDQNFLIQPYLEGATEYRILLVKQKPLLIVKKFLDDKDGINFKLNLSRNNQAEILKEDELPLHLLEWGQFIAKNLKLGLCAIDFLVTDSKSYILEINHGPGWSETESLLKEKKINRNLTAEILEHIIKE